VIHELVLDYWVWPLRCRLSVSLLAGVNAISEGKKPADGTVQRFPKPAPPSQDALSNARAQVQEEITREFASIMASGSLRASEAAALAARRVLQRHGIRGSATSSQA
jgi:hypothetical protein